MKDNCKPWGTTGLSTWEVYKVKDRFSTYPYGTQPARFLGTVEAMTIQSAFHGACSRWRDEMNPFQDFAGFALRPI